MISDVPVLKQDKKLSPFQQHFINSYNDVDSKEKKEEKKEKIYYTQEIVEYADTLTTWVRNLMKLN